MPGLEPWLGCSIPFLSKVFADVVVPSSNLSQFILGIFSCLCGISSFSFSICASFGSSVFNRSFACSCLISGSSFLSIHSISVSSGGFFQSGLGRSLKLSASSIVSGFKAVLKIASLPGVLVGNNSSIFMVRCNIICSGFVTRSGSSKCFFSICAFFKLISLFISG